MLSRAAAPRIGPDVPAVQASGIATSWVLVGAVIRTEQPSHVHPRPNGPQLSSLRVGEAPAGEALLRPLVRFLHLRRAGQARTDPVHQLRGGLHDLRVVEFLEPDLRDHVEVDATPGRAGRRRRSATRQAAAMKRFRGHLLCTKPRHGTTAPRGGSNARPGAASRRPFEFVAISLSKRALTACNARAYTGTMKARAEQKGARRLCLDFPNVRCTDRRSFMTIRRTLALLGALGILTLPGAALADAVDRHEHHHDAGHRSPPFPRARARPSRWTTRWCTRRSTTPCRPSNTGTSRMPSISRRTSGSVDAAVAKAAHDVLVNRFPAQAVGFLDPAYNAYLDWPQHRADTTREWP